ncbi:hypothetical protein E2C01_048096 [Portunus trituberculatus]|uniref:Uncharacterized protein n=1 Tax=Portunus trituberculatus TaxID=210409 RepID=A0A5B7GAM2_PORTR|nr:hypothetical protein [Portunus trituberculatus]
MHCLVTLFYDVTTHFLPHHRKAGQRSGFGRIIKPRILLATLRAKEQPVLVQYVYLRIFFVSTVAAFYSVLGGD